MIYIKDNIRKGVKLIRNDIDSIVWVKLDKDFFQTSSDRYIAAVYIPPESSPMHNIYNINFFQKLENEITLFSNKGDVYLVGDLNSRTGRSCDYITNDSTIPGHEDNYAPVDTPSRRRSLDSVVNRYGTCLLDLCKSTGIRILNGRLFNNTDKMTSSSFHEAHLGHILSYDQDSS